MGITTDDTTTARIAVPATPASAVCGAIAAVQQHSRVALRPLGFLLEAKLPMAGVTSNVRPSGPPDGLPG